MRTKLRTGEVKTKRPMTRDGSGCCKNRNRAKECHRTSRIVEKVLPSGIPHYMVWKGFGTARVMIMQSQC